MAKARTPRTPKATSNPVITMPEAGTVSLVRKSSALTSSPADLETKIRERAYELYQDRGCAPGLDIQDWLRAEREVLARQTHQQTA
jgi:Protein of unknown function (DUF2934)